MELPEEATLTVFSCNTAHITTKDDDLLTRYIGGVKHPPTVPHPQIVMKYADGYIVSSWHEFTTASEVEEKLLKLGHSEAYINIIRLASDHNYHWVNFDTEGTEYRFLPLYEW